MGRCIKSDDRLKTVFGENVVSTTQSGFRNVSFYELVYIDYADDTLG